MHLRPADFFTTNPALDVPSTRNQASVLVPCCGSNEKAAEGMAATEKVASVQDSPLSHLQGGQPDIDAQKAGAGVQNGDSNGKSEKRLSKTLAGLFKMKGKE